MFESGVGVMAGWLPDGFRSSNVLVGLWLELGATGPGVVLGGLDTLAGADNGIGEEIGAGGDDEDPVPRAALPTVDDEPSDEIGQGIVEMAGGGDIEGGGPIRLGAGSAPLDDGIGEIVLGGGALLTQDGQAGAGTAAGIAV